MYLLQIQIWREKKVNPRISYIYINHFKYIILKVTSMNTKSTPLFGDLYFWKLFCITEKLHSPE